MEIVQASRHALIQRRKNDKEQEKSLDRNLAEMIKLRNVELDTLEAREREDIRQRIEDLKSYQLKQVNDRK